MWYHETKSTTTCQRKFKVLYSTKKAPNHSSIKLWYERFLEEGNMKGSKRGRKKMDTEKIERVAGHFDATPKCSIRQASQVLGYKKSSVHNIVKHELKLYPYKISVHHALKETDKTLRVNFAETILDRIALDEDYLSRICFSDEATFHVSGTVHRHNVRIWGKEHPREFQEFTPHSPKINVWCGLTKDRVVGPFFFTEQIVTGQSYLRMLETFAYPVLRNIDNVIFQQDGAPPHWALVVRDSLNEKIPNSWIGRDGPTAWPPRSPDVTPLDFFSGVF